MNREARHYFIHIVKRRKFLESVLEEVVDDLEGGVFSADFGNDFIPLHDFMCLCIFSGLNFFPHCLHIISHHHHNHDFVRANRYVVVITMI